MHGTVGVAPALGEVRSSLAPGDWGGNMDTPEMRAGTTCYLGVNVPGALFSLGDGHARQGEGETCGVAVECAMDTVLVLDLIKGGPPTPWPRLEDDTFIMTTGSARPLEDAFRIAHTEMVRWVQELTGLSDMDAYQLVTPDRADADRQRRRHQLHGRHQGRQALPARRAGHAGHARALPASLRPCPGTSSWRPLRDHIAWEEFIPFLDYDVEIRTVICSTKAIESLNARHRRAVKARGHFPTEQAAMKCLYLVTRFLDPTGRGRARWTMRWKPALNAFAITFADRWPAAETALLH